MAILCPGPRLLFIENPRTGCTSIANTLMDRLGGIPLTRPDSDDYWKHIRVKEIRQHGFLSKRDLKELWTFAAIRNPYDLVASLFQKRRNMSRFPLEIKQRSWWWDRPKTRREVDIASEGDFETFAAAVAPNGSEAVRRQLDGVDVILRFEHLEKQFPRFLEDAGIRKPPPLSKDNPTPNKKDYRNYYSEKSRRAVESGYADLLREYAYSFEGCDDEIRVRRPKGKSGLIPSIKWWARSQKQWSQKQRSQTDRRTPKPESNPERPDHGEVATMEESP